MFRKMIPAFVVAAVLLAACGATPATPAGQLKVVATFSILGDLVKNVAGDKIQLRILVGPNADTHTFEPSPADGVALADAQVIFENGLGFEQWLNKLYESSGSKGKRVVVTAGLAPSTIAIGADAGATDPHAWQNVTYAVSMVTIIRDSLIKEDPGNAGAYQTNAAAYLKQLNDLNQFITEQAAAIPPNRRKLVTNHDALGYFAKQYGFKIIGSALGSVSTEAGDPSAAQIARLVDEIKGAGVPTIFTENVENAKVIEQVAHEAGVTVGQPLYTDALGQPGTDGETYLKMMRHNINTIEAGLK